MFANEFDGMGLFFLMMGGLYLAPFIVLALAVRSLLKAGGTGWLSLLLLVASGLVCWYGTYLIGWEKWKTARGASLLFALAIWAASLAFPATLVWEGYQRGWLDTWIKSWKKARKRARKQRRRSE